MEGKLRCVQQGPIEGRDVGLYVKDSAKGIYYIGPGSNGRFAQVYTGIGDIHIAYMNAKREGFNIDPSEIGIPVQKPMEKKLPIDMG